MSLTTQWLSLSRAARLVGVVRGELQRKIRLGELSAFDGMVSIDALLHAYPKAQLEDETEYSRILHIKEKAFGKRVFERALPDAATLATRITELSRELAKSQAHEKQYRQFFERLQKHLDEMIATRNASSVALAQELNAWLSKEQQNTMEADFPNPLAVRDHLLRVMAAHVRVLPSGHDFFVEGSDTLLEGALRAGVPLGYGCSGGNCGLCRARVVSGQVKKIHHHDYMLSEHDKQRGYVLLCCNTAVTDVELDASVAGGVQDIPLQQIDAKVKTVTPLNADMMLLHLQTPRSSRLRFLAGQSVTLKLGEFLTDELAIASCPCDDRNLLFHIPRQSGKLFSDYIFERIKVNETVGIEGPQGEFVLQEKSARALYFFAFDTGFAPIKSLIEHALSLDNGNAIHLFWLATDEAHRYLPNVPRAWADALDNFHYTPLLFGAYTAMHEQKLNALLHDILRQHPDLLTGDIYIAGVENNSAVAEQFFLSAGLPKTRVFLSALAA